MKSITQKVNLMSCLTSISVVSDKVLEESSINNKVIKKMVESNSKSKIFK